jgi:hypothetical protein
MHVIICVVELDTHACIHVDKPDASAGLAAMKEAPSAAAMPAVRSFSSFRLICLVCCGAVAP